MRDTLLTTSALLAESIPLYFRQYFRTFVFPKTKQTTLLLDFFLHVVIANTEFSEVSLPSSLNHFSSERNAPVILFLYINVGNMFLYEGESDQRRLKAWSSSPSPIFITITYNLETILFNSLRWLVIFVPSLIFHVWNFSFRYNQFEVFFVWYNSSNFSHYSRLVRFARTLLARLSPTALAAHISRSSKYLSFIVDLPGSPSRFNFCPSAPCVA